MPALFSEYSALVRKLEERLTTEKLDELRKEFTKAQKISQARKRFGSSSSYICKSLLALESLDCGGLGKRSFTFTQIPSSIPSHCAALLSLYKDRRDDAVSGAMVDGKTVSFTTHREII